MRIRLKWPEELVGGEEMVLSVGGHSSLEHYSLKPIAHLPHSIQLRENDVQEYQNIMFLYCRADGLPEWGFCGLMIFLIIFL